MKKFYYLAGTSPLDCRFELFEESLYKGTLSGGFDLYIEAVDNFISFYEGESFYRIFEVDDKGACRSLEGYAPDGSLINDIEWVCRCREATIMLEFSNA